MLLALPTVAVIGLRNESYMVDESDGSIRVYVQFISPDEISEDIIVNVTLTTVDMTAFGMACATSLNHAYAFTDHSYLHCTLCVYLQGEVTLIVQMSN